MVSDIALSLHDVRKTYPGVVALDEVTLEVVAGEIHALVGENGAGKSTLMAVAAGVTRPDSGRVTIGGNELQGADAVAALRHGLAVAYQHPALSVDLTVAENLVLGMPPGHRPSAGQAKSWAEGVLAEMDVDVHPETRVSDLTVAQRHLVEIAGALAHEPSVLVLDEPTEPLNADEIERLFAKLAQLREAGVAIVYISHRIPDVKRIADRLTVLRSGRVRGTFRADEVREDEIVALIVGRPLDVAFPPKRESKAAVDAAVLSVTGLTGEGFDEVSLSVARGEIVGLAGIEGNGQKEFLRALAGLGRGVRGEVSIDGKRTSVSTPVRARAAGISYAPGDRQREGLFMGLGVRENAGIETLSRTSLAGFLRPAAERGLVRGSVGRLAVKTPSLETPVSSLSGGNQQKVLMARSLLAEPRVLLADEPTQGVDAGARLEMYTILRDVAAAGQAVVVMSSDALELAGLCDRVLIFSRGRVVEELTQDEVSEEGITEAALTATTLRNRAAEERRGGRLRRALSGDYLPAVVLALAVAALGAYTTGHEGLFFSQLNITSLLLLATSLMCVSFGQLLVMMTGGVDLSVGPLCGLLVVVASFTVTEGTGYGGLAEAVVAMAGVAIAVGLTNALLFRVAKLTPVVATLVTYTILQGIALMLRPLPEGNIALGVSEDLQQRIGWVPVAFIVVLAVGIGLEMWLRRRRGGIAIRAVGSDEEVARRLGARPNLVYFGAYIGCALCVAAGSVMLAMQVGIGDPTAGSTYTFQSITAVVLGGAAIAGGRGSFIGVMLGALLLQTIISATGFLELDAAWQEWLAGGLTLISAAVYSRARTGGGFSLTRPRLRRLRPATTP